MDTASNNASPSEWSFIEWGKILASGLVLFVVLCSINGVNLIKVAGNLLK